jgi:hypothetical protein
MKCQRAKASTATDYSRSRNNTLPRLFEQSLNFVVLKN